MKWLDGDCPGFFLRYSATNLRISAAGDLDDARYWGSLGLRLFPPMFEARGHFKMALAEEKARCEGCRPGPPGWDPTSWSGMPKNLP